MKKLLGIMVLGLLLSGCATDVRILVQSNELPIIENEDYIIVPRYLKKNEIKYEADSRFYNIIVKHCEKKNKKVYKARYNSGISYSKEGFKINYGKRYWCANSIKEASDLWIKYLNNPDEYQNSEQKRFQIKKKKWAGKNEDKTQKYLAKLVNGAKFVLASEWWYLEKEAQLYQQQKVKTKKEEPKEAKKKESKKAEKKAERAAGSAFFVSNTGYIITNFHVIETCNDNSKIFYNTNEIDTKLIAKDEYLDLALLKAEVNNNKFITISNTAPRKLQKIIAAGYPFGKYLSDDMKFTSGIISSLKGVKDDSTRLQIDAALNPGNSGGPIVDENTGELVAVAVAGLRKDVTEAVNYGIKAGSVKNFLESNQIDPSTFSKKFSTEDVAKLLESTVLYTFCN